MVYVVYDMEMFDMSVASNEGVIRDVAHRVVFVCCYRVY